MEPNVPVTDFPVLPMVLPVPQYVPQATNGQAVAPPPAEGISAGNAPHDLLQVLSNLNQMKSLFTTVKSDYGVSKPKRKSAMPTSSS